MATAPGNIEVCSIHQKTSCGTVFRHTEVFRAFISEILAPTGEKELCLRSSKYIFDRLIFIQSFWIVCRPQCNTFSSQLLSSKVMTRYKNSWQLDKWQRDAYKTVGWGGLGEARARESGNDWTWRAKLNVNCLHGWIPPEISEHMFFVIWATSRKVNKDAEGQIYMSFLIMKYKSSQSFERCEQLTFWIRFEMSSQMVISEYIVIYGPGYGAEWWWAVSELTN